MGKGGVCVCGVSGEGRGEMCACVRWVQGGGCKNIFNYADQTNLSQLL